MYVFIWKYHKETPCVDTFISNFFFLLFSSTKLENRRAEQVLPGEGRVGTSGRVEVVGKGGRRVNTVQKLSTHVCKYKNYTC
jgi:hypothetical protein